MSTKRSVLLLSLIFHGNVVAFSTCFLSANHHHNLASIKKRNVSLLSSTNTVQSEVETSALVNKSSFYNFDYLSHWYPVSWARDLELDTPTKVSIFDVDYVVAKINGNTGKGKDAHDPEVIAMVDVCPHKTAALSEGRITEGGNFQCAYHGWKFDSKTGACIEIPQVERLPTGTDCDGTAIPAMISQDIVWLFPGGGLEKALLHPPPEIPELNKEGYRMLIQTVRDFPIDWTILIENIMDPDHGLFAHQTTGFDYYSASKTNPMILEEEEVNDGKGVILTSKVKANYVLLKRNEEKLSVENPSKKKKFADRDDAPVATTTFHVPSLIYMGRRDNNGDANLMTSFFICPTGTGKSRFMSAQIVKDVPKWVKIPRWFVHSFLNGFVDQDTFLLSTQQKRVLGTESQLSLEVGVSNDMRTSLPVRKKIYKYRSPSEKLGIRVGQWLDKTIFRVPNRTSKIRSLGGYEPAVLALSKTREEVLDRYDQHTRICKDSMDTLKNCQKLRAFSKRLAIVPVLFQTLIFGIQSRHLGMLPPIVASILTKIKNPLRPSVVLSIWLVAAIIDHCSKKVEREFKFKYTEEYRVNDMDKITGLWMDER